MTSYYVMKYLHILSAVIMVGTGFGSALYVFFANRSGSLTVQHFANSMVVRLDWYLTTPTVIIQPLTGWWLIQHVGWQWNSAWLMSAYILYLLIGLAWLPVVWLQVKMYRCTAQALRLNTALDERYIIYQRYWERLGYVGFSGAIVVFYIMVSKISLW